MMLRSWVGGGWWAILVVSVGAASCQLIPEPRPARQLAVATWNVQNLFDEVDDGTEYPEFDPGRGWTQAQFWQRCDRLAAVIRTLGDRGPDILVLQEVEGTHAVEVLNQRFLPDLGYRYTTLAPPEVPGVKTAVLSRFPILRTGLHFPASAPEEDPLRPVLEAEIDLGGRSLVILGNHWKSRIPSPQATERLRLEAARTLRTRLAALETRPDRPWVLAVGDFNTSLELSRPWPRRALVSALSADSGDEGLLVFARRPAAGPDVPAGSVWDPWETVAEPQGSYRYRGDWNRLDHTFVLASSLKLTDWGFGSFRAVAYASEPQAFGLQNPDGVSDHFPLVLTLVRRSAQTSSP